MKKLLFTILSLSLSLVFALSGCSCAATPQLSFNKAYLEDENYGGNYFERLEYLVEYKSSYQSITNTAEIDEAKIPQYNGTYVVEFSNSNNTSLPDGVSTDIDYEPDYHYIKSILTLDVTFDDGTVYNDKIISEIYFHSKNWSLAPVYSKTTMKNTYIMVNDETAKEQMIYEFSTLYKKSDYTVTKKYYQKDEKEDINLIDIANTTDADNPNYFNTQKLVAMSGDGESHDYTIRNVVDNVQLMFAIRNSNISDSDSIVLPTTSFAYDSPISIYASHKNDTDNTISELIYNGETLQNVNIPVKNIEFSINSTTDKGSPKYLSIQKAEVNGIKNNALIVEYAEPLLSGLSNAGALVYKLKQVTITK